MDLGLIYNKIRVGVALKSFAINQNKLYIVITQIKYIFTPNSPIKQMKQILSSLVCLLLFQTGQAQNNIDAAFALNETTVCFIKGDKVVHYNIQKQEVITTKNLQKSFPNLPFDKIDAVWDNQKGKLYLFNGSQAVSFDKKTKQLDSETPQAIGEGGLNLALNKVDAAMTWDNGKSFFFSSNKFIQYDNEKGLTDERFPKRTVEQLWAGMKFNYIHAAFSLKGKTYFFSAHQFVVFDIENKQADSHPQKICDLTGLCEALDIEPYVGIDFFEGTWKEALIKAKAENKHIFLDAYTSWCGPCKKMAAQTFPLATVGKVFNEKFICLKMNMEQGEARNLGKVYQITTYPTLLFVNSKGEVLKRTASALGEEKFIELGKSVE